MVDIHVIARNRKNLYEGFLEIWEEEDGSLAAIDILGFKEYKGEYPPKGYMPVYEFFKITHSHAPTKSRLKELLKTVKVTEMYVFVEDDDDFWAYFNHKCNTCKRKCKQSHKVEIVSCPQYEAI